MLFDLTSFLGMVVVMAACGLSIIFILSIFDKHDKEDEK